MSATYCDEVLRFVHTPDGWQEWLNHLDDCAECKQDLVAFYEDQA